MILKITKFTKQHFFLKKKKQNQKTKVKETQKQPPSPFTNLNYKLKTSSLVHQQGPVW